MTKTTATLNTSPRTPNRAAAKDFLMSDVQSESVEVRPPALFFKCPVGGFASLRPGVCPKCHEPLAPALAPDTRNGYPGGGRERAYVRDDDVPDRQGV